jgi:hypothetical protein
LINRYELLSRRIKTLKQWVKNDGYDWLRDGIRLMEEDKRGSLRRLLGRPQIIPYIGRLAHYLDSMIALRLLS